MRSLPWPPPTAALTAFETAVTGVTGLAPPGQGGDWDEQRPSQPAQTGIHAIDDQRLDARTCK